ncbi:MAG: hypothetical protein KF745_02085 [Phycisphaeraceae bacterium]|nr:hypothetical protein [Phycisphaeraceae bacterium]
MSTTMPKNEGDLDILGRVGPGGAVSPKRDWGIGDMPEEAYDALTDLFLGEVGGRSNRGVQRTDGPSPAIDGSEAAAGIELLVMGHLPVLGSAWASQYARTAAEAEESTICFVQVRSGHVVVELVGCATSIQGTGIEDALAKAAAISDRWIIRADETDEPGLSQRPEVRWVTLLTSADEVAVVGAYRAIARLAGGEGAELEAERPLGAMVRVAVMGSSDDAADQAYSKISSAVRTFVRRPLRRAPGASRIKPGRSSTMLFSGKVEGGADRVMDLIGLAVAGSTPNTHEDARIEPPVPHTAAAPTDRSTAEIPASLARHIPGLTPLPIRCPGAPSIDFAVGESGSLHALGHRTAGAGDVTGSLLSASAWATANASLIAMAVKGVTAESGVVQHLLTDEPRDVRGLLESDVRVHVLASVEVDGKTGWVCRPLN